MIKTRLKYLLHCFFYKRTTGYLLYTKTDANVLMYNALRSENWIKIALRIKYSLQVMSGTVMTANTFSDRSEFAIDLHISGSFNIIVIIILKCVVCIGFEQWEDGRSAMHIVIIHFTAFTYSCVQLNESWISQSMHSIEWRWRWRCYCIIKIG